MHGTTSPGKGAETPRPQTPQVEETTEPAWPGSGLRSVYGNPSPPSARVLRNSNQGPERLNSWQACLLATASPILALLAMRALPAAVEGQLVTVIFVMPIIISAYRGGLSAGLIATAVSCLLAITS